MAVLVPMAPFAAALRTILVLVALLFVGAVPVPAETLNFVCIGLPATLAACRDSVDRWSDATGHTVNVIAAPDSPSRTLELVQALLDVGATEIDALTIDVIWPAILDRHLLDLALAAPGDATSAMPLAAEQATIGERRVALPWYVDGGALFYRRDLLDEYGYQVPKTWSELAATAKTIQDRERAAGRSDMWGFVWQGGPDEGLAANTLEWIRSYGGAIVDADGTVSVALPEAVAAVREAASWLGTISPPEVLEMRGAQSLGAFMEGNAVFMRHWLSSYGETQAADGPLEGRVGIALLPSGSQDGPRASALGGWMLAVPRYSEKQELAKDLVAFMASDAEQRRTALDHGLPPASAALYEDPTLRESRPEVAALARDLDVLIARPAKALGPRYGQVSKVYRERVAQALQGHTTPEEAMRAAAHQIRQGILGNRR